MKERPIIFSAPMVRAILAGTKTQTRRAVKPQPKPWGCGGLQVPGYCSSTAESFRSGMPIFMSKFGKPGDRLWVRESHWWFIDERDPVTGYTPPLLTIDDVSYRADGDDGRTAWRSPIHMPRWASRITLEITGVRVERLQDISEADAMAEGCELECMTPTGDDSGSAIYGPGGYRALWESINGPGSWAANPWVWVVEFRRVEGGAA